MVVTVIGGEKLEGGISYTNLEALNLHLGSGTRSIDVTQRTRARRTSTVGTAAMPLMLRRSWVTPLWIWSGSRYRQYRERTPSRERSVDCLPSTAAGMEISSTSTTRVHSQLTATLTQTTLTGLFMGAVAAQQSVSIQASRDLHTIQRDDHDPTLDNITLNYSATADQVATALNAAYDGISRFGKTERWTVVT